MLTIKAKYFCLLANGGTPPFTGDSPVTVEQFIADLDERVDRACTTSGSTTR
jgi:hypothetical protein